MSDQTQLTTSTADGFGSLPLNFTPGALKRLLGCSVFSVNVDCISIQHGEKATVVDYSELKEISCSGRVINLLTSAGEQLKINPGSDPAALVSVLARLKDESCRFKQFFNDAASFTVEKCLDFFSQCLDFRGQPYVMAADVLLHTALLHNFSDIHLEPLDSTFFRMSYRVAAEIKPSLQIARTQAERLIARCKYLAGCLSHVNDTPQEGAFRQGNFSVRLSTFPTDTGERVSLRIITAVKYPDLSALGWEQPTIDLWRQQIFNNTGLFIISGPVGSGKTTAMYATLAELANQNRNLRVVTIEDPVEAKIDGICQSSLDSMKESSLAAAFKHLLRQDPDVLALGEIRDSLCIREALQASLSGHLILATFHAGSAGEAIDRIRQMGVEDYLIMSGLKGILHLNLNRHENQLKPVVNFRIVEKCGIKES